MATCKIKCEVFYLRHHVSTQKVLDFGAFKLSHFWIKDVQAILVTADVEFGEGNIRSRMSKQVYLLPGIYKSLE